MGKLKLIIIAAAAAAAVAACSGGSDPSLVGGGVAGGGGGAGGGGAGGTGLVRIGNGFGAGFVNGLIDISVTSLTAGGSTGLSVSLVNDTGNLHTGDVTVTFSSPCIAQGLATVDGPVATATGFATATYTAVGCSTADPITATATVDGITLTATGTITVAPATVGSINFISATPSNIGLQGTGGAGRSETSIVVFRVVDSSGGPVANTSVDFTLDSTVGGINITPMQATSDFSGNVQTVVQSGTVATTVRVAAVVTALGIGTQSDELTVTTGIPDKDSVSLSIETLNPEAWNTDGVVNIVTIRLSDRFNNPVPDGTAVTFTTEGAQIGSQCTTVDGACSVNWTSQNPRPADGRVTLLATSIGEESFVDGDANGRFSVGDTFTDIGEPFRDDDEDGLYNAGVVVEPFLDFDSDGVRDAPDGFFSGLLCDAATGLCSPADTLAVSDVGFLRMSACQVDVVAGGFPAAITAPASFGGVFQDLQGNPLPAGTTIAFSTANGTVVGGASFTVPNTLSPTFYSVFVDVDGTPSTGPVFVDVTCPSGLQLSFSGSVTD